MAEYLHNSMNGNYPIKILYINVKTIKINMNVTKLTVVLSNILSQMIHFLLTYGDQPKTVLECTLKRTTRVHTYVNSRLEYIQPN
jgi:hypothetical protein